jgi:prophage maintenance system killer protein
MGGDLDLGDLLAIAEAVLGEPAEDLQHSVSVRQAQAALAEALASFGGIYFYSDPVQRAAICCSRIIRHRPFPRRNSWIAYLFMREILEREGFAWPHFPDYVAEVSAMVEALAVGTLSEEQFVSWVRSRVASKGGR